MRLRDAWAAWPVSARLGSLAQGALLAALCAPAAGEPAHRSAVFGETIPLPIPFPAPTELPLSPPGGAILDADLALGYDSNPAQSSDGPSLAFARYLVGASGPLGLPASGLGWAAEGWFRDYEGSNDSWSLSLRGEGTKALSGGLAELRLTVEALAYRDTLVEADSRNELAVTLAYDGVLSARADLGLSATVRRQHYTNPTLPWEGRPGSGPLVRENRGRTGEEQDSAGHSGREAAGRGGPRGSAEASDAREDWLGSMGVETAWHALPTLTALLGLSAERCDSTVPVESYWSLGADLTLRAEPSASWSLDLELGWYATDYDRAPRGLERRDRGVLASLAVRRPLGVSGRELYCDLSWLDNASNLEAKSFVQTVTQCGLTWRF